MRQVLLIEDEDDLRDLLEYNLSGSGYCVNAISDANNAVPLVKNGAVDLVVLDLMLPGMHGLDFLKLLRENNVNTPVIIISAMNTESDVIKSIKLGADDYVIKPFNFEYLDTKINALFRRIDSTDNHKNKNGIVINEEALKVMVDGETIILTRKEYDLLLLFINNPGVAFSREQLLTSIWGYEQVLMTRTIDAHVASLRRKLKSKGGNIVTVSKVGYIWEEN